MRRVAGLLFAAILLLSLPAFAPAMGLFGVGTPGFPSAFGGTSGSSYCDPGTFCCPAIYFGYNVEQKRDRRPTTFGINNTDPIRQAIGQNQLTVGLSDPSGFWLGLSEYCRLDDRFGIMASGWYLFPSSNNGDEVYDFGLGSRLWGSNRSEGWIDGAVVLGSQCGLNLIGGFRWDSYSVRLRNPVALDPALGVRGTPQDEADLRVNWYIPFLGTQYCCGGPCCGLLVRVIGFPWVPGDVRYGETGFFAPGTRLDGNWTFDRSRFIEVFAEASRDCGFGCVGFFARFNYLDGKGTAAPTVLLPGGGVVAFPSEDFTINRTSWTLGGKMTVNFDMPGLRSFGLYF
jgi:hypothetical protein